MRAAEIGGHLGRGWDERNGPWQSIPKVRLLIQAVPAYGLVRCSIIRHNFTNLVNFAHRCGRMDRPGEMAVFVRVVEAGGFSAAARASGLTPSAVSKLIGRLEDRLGARLLHRTTRSISLTHEGVAFYQRSVRILRDIDEAEQAISQLHAVPSGRLRVNAAVAFATYQIVPILPEYLDQYPQVHLELTVTDRVVDVVEEGVDVAIRLGARVDSSLISRQLAVDHRIICAAPRYLARHGMPATPSELAPLQLPDLDRQSGRAQRLALRRSRMARTPSP